MKPIIVLCCVFLIAISVNAQPKGASTIRVLGVTFDELTNALLDKGFQFDRVDSNLLALRTDFIDGSGKNKWIKYRIIARVKDSTAIIVGEWYNTLFIGHKLLGQEQTIENSTYKIEYSTGAPKKCFIEMDNFAKTFNKPVEYE